MTLWPDMRRLFLTAALMGISGCMLQAADAGFPVTDPLVVAKCSGCHAKDKDGNLSRISWIRTTPEGWEEAIKRMIRLNGLQLQPDEARQILRYLADNHGLAPEEAKSVAFMAEHRMIDEKVPSDDVAHACKACHPLGKPLSWRRSPEDWKLLRNMHEAFFPNVNSTAFLRAPRPASAPPPPPGTDQRHYVDIALDYFAKNGPLHSPEWANWSGTQHAPKLAGKWLISGSQPGQGKVFGEMEIEAGSSAGSFTTKTRIVYARTGKVLSGSGAGLLYTGYAWRGRWNSPEPIRQVMTLSNDQSTMEGRWFWGTYQEFGMDIVLHRAGSGTAVQGVDITSLKTGSTSVQARVFGPLPGAISESDIDFGAGVKVAKIVKREPGAVTVSLDVSANAKPGRRDVMVKDVVLPAAIAVYDHIDYIKVSDETALAHLGSEPHAKGYWQFEAVAYHNGPDGKPHTADDIELGPVPVQWKIEEFVATFGDDDTQFVGKIDPDTGLFTPALDGPNPKRRQQRNNYGDVWVVATYTPPGTSTPLSAKSYLVVAVPQYIQWDMQAGAGTQ